MGDDENEQHDAKRFGPDDYRRYLDTLPLNETFRLHSRVLEALATAQHMAPKDIEAMQIETNIVWVFERTEGWDETRTAASKVFGPTHIPYLQRRADEVQQPLFSAYYRLAAWFAERRTQYASAALETLLATVEHFERSSEPGEVFMGLRRSVFLAYGIAAAARRLDDVRLRVLGVVRDLRAPFGVLRSELAKLLVDDSKTDKSLLAQVRPIVAELVLELAPADNDLIRGLVALGKRIDARLGESHEREWDQLQGVALERWITFHPEPIVKALGAQQAAAAYRRAGDEAKAVAMYAVEKAAIEAQETVTIAVPFEGDLDSHVVEQRRVFRRILENEGADGVLRMLSVGPYIIPDVAAVRADEEQMRRDGIGNFMHAVVQSHTVSADGRIIDHAQPGSDQERRSFLQSYGIRVKGYATLAMAAFVQELVVSDEVTFDDVILFFGNSWFTRMEAGASEPDYAILKLLAPALRIWVETSRGERSIDELIPTLDSLVPKVETVLRKMARGLRMLDIKSVERDGVLVDQHRGIELIADPVMREALGADLGEFAAYVLDRTGEGFRDRLAHGAVHGPEYSFEQADLVVLTLLRLAGRPPKSG